MNLNDTSCVGKGFSSGLKPDPKYSVSTWADNFRVLSSKSSAEPGRWRTDRTPYLRKIMDCLSSDSRFEKIVFKAGSQLGKSETGNNWLGYIIDKSPAPTLIVQPTVDMAKKFSQQRIDPMIESTDALRHRVTEKKSRDSGNTILMKSFEGGLILLTGANSPTGLRSMPIRFVFMDEIDAYPDDAGGEGDPIELAIRRSATFSKRKIFLVSTPTTEESSKIEKLYNETDQQKYFVPCPECGEFQIIQLDNLTYDKDAKGNPILTTVKLACIHCGSLIPEFKKTQMLAAGEWRATCPENSNPKEIGFHISSLYSPVGWYSWAQAIDDYEAAKGSVSKMKTFVNTVLGETWKDKGDAPDWRRLYDRREFYKIGTVPQGGLVLTAAVDVQKDRLEMEIKAWGRGLRSWSVDYRILLGDTNKDDVWNQLSEFVNEEFTHESGLAMRISKLVIDSGFNTQRVYNWSRMQNPARVMAVKGSDNLQQIMSNPRNVDVRTDGKKISRGARIFLIGSSMIKHEVYGWLKAEKPLENETDPFGYARFPEYGQEFFQGLASEQLVKKKHHGFDKFYWEKIFERNEPLDLFVMNRVAAYALGLDRWKNEQWAKTEAQFQIVKKEIPKHNDTEVLPVSEKEIETNPEPKIAVPIVESRPRRKIIRKKSSFW